MIMIIYFTAFIKLKHTILSLDATEPLVIIELSYNE